VGDRQSVSLVSQLQDTMHTLTIAIFLCSAILWTRAAKTAICPPGVSRKTYKLKEGDTYTYKTQGGRKYQKATKCEAIFKHAKRNQECTLNINCSKFKIPNRSKKCSKGGDYMQIQSLGNKNRYCRKNGPDAADGSAEGNKPLKVLFKSGKKSKGSSGAKCTVSCAPTPAPVVMNDCNCGLAQRTTRIVGGVETEVNEYPWQVGMVSTGTTRIWCGGSLISDQWVMTAAHCVIDEASPSGIEVLLGEHDKTSTTESDMVRMGVSEIINHASYVASTTDYDFALLKLSEPIVFAEHPHIRPICMPVDDSKDYADYIATVTGWGTLEFMGSSPDKLMEVDVKVHSHQSCQNDFNYASYKITDQMVCASAEDGQGGKDSCQGDSGGPMVTKEDSSDGQTAGQNYELIGVVSWGWGCANADEPGVYSRMTAQLDWVLQKTSGSYKVCARE